VEEIMCKKLHLKIPVLVALLIGWTVAADAQPPDFAVLAEQLKPAVVNISTEKTVRSGLPSLRSPDEPGGKDPFDEFFERFFRGTPQAPRKARSLGSGFIISADGYILTNEHVVDGADEIRVKLSDGREFSGEVRGLDPKLDLALVKIDAGGSLPMASLGDSEAVKVGEWVMAIGNPFGLEQTVTVGIVSAKGRVIGAGPYDDFIQTDASINPGNSGGPLFNVQGEVIGINTAIVAGGRGIGFAIPVNMAKQIIPQLRDEGRVIRGWLGVTVQALNRELADSFGRKSTEGALVNEVVAGSPAEKAGLRRGDIILLYNGQRIVGLNDLPRLVAATPVGRTVMVVIFRDGRERTIKVTLGRLAEEAQVQAAGDKQTGGTLGITVANLTPALAERFGVDGQQGILITEVDPDGPGAEANLRAGDLILEVDGREVSSITAFEDIIGRQGAGKVVRLLIQRKSNLLYSAVTLR
jgi:serine protease Do